LENKTVIILLGPTASGKTGLAISLAQYFQTSIISADSRQCFRELNIGVAKPSAEQLQLVHHDFINSHSISDQVNAALFEQLALQWTEKIFQKTDIVIMPGGTGLYIKSFCEGLDEIPPVSPAIREEIQAAYEAGGIEWLQEQIREKDPEFYRRGEILNPHRLLRALEVKLASGNSILSYRNQSEKKRPFNVIKIGLQLSRDELHRNINLRTHLMMKQGLLDEVKELIPYRHYNALRTVGYSELFDYLDEKISLDQAIELIKKNTRQYAKRQLTWFRRDRSIRWMHPNDATNFEKIIKS
jgi:tRNA dimethylallyltransferase